MELVMNLLVPVVCGMKIPHVGVSLPNDHKLTLYGGPKGWAETTCFLIAAFLAALDFCGGWILFLRLTRRFCVSLEVISNDLAVQFSSMTFVAAVGSAWGGYWWIRLKSLRRCIVYPSFVYHTTECEKEIYWVPMIQAKLLRRNEMNGSSYPGNEGMKCSEGCKLGPYEYSYTHFVHVLPSMVFTFVLGLVAAIVVLKLGGFGGNGGGGGGDERGTSPRESHDCPSLPGDSPSSGESQKGDSPPPKECERCGEIHKDSKDEYAEGNHECLSDDPNELSPTCIGKSLFSKDCDDCGQPHLNSEENNNKEQHESSKGSTEEVECLESSLSQRTTEELANFKEFQAQKLRQRRKMSETASQLTATSLPTFNTLGATAPVAGNPRSSSRIISQQKANSVKSLKRGRRK